MFYEIQEKRMSTGSQTRWWLAAAFSTLIVTGAFVGTILWLGVSVRQPDPQPNFDQRTTYRDEGQQLQQYRPVLAQPNPPPPKFEYPAAEILKTTIKNKKGRIDIVELNTGEKSTPKTWVSTLTTSSSTFQTTSEMPTNPPTVVVTETVKQSREHELRAKISQLSSAQLAYVGAEPSSLQEGVSPYDEFSIPSAKPGNSVKKKSEAVPPAWFDPSLHSTAAKVEQAPNDVKRQNVYELPPDLAHIKPDLSAFNTKTIPAFTYLKEPLPEYHSLLDVEGVDSSRTDDSFYYEHGSPSQNHARHPNTSFISVVQRRLHNLQDWLLFGSRTSNVSAHFTEVVKLVNSTLHNKKLLANIFSKLKHLYTNFKMTDIESLQSVPVSNLLYPASPSILGNSTSLISFGLLAIDLFLLHNVQQIVWQEEAKIGDEMLQDPDVVALNALFMSPDRIQQLRQTKSSRIPTNGEKRSAVHDLLEFVNGGLRAVLNLGKAYKSSTTKSNARSSSTGSTLDCIWTLYCRNLDKTAKLHGPYGFLAKMNRLGLRLMMGEFPVEKALDKLVKEYNNGWGPLDCDKLFPKCGADEAKEVVIQTALGRTSI